MAKRASRTERFAVIKTLYSTYKSGYLAIDAVAQNVEKAGCILYKSELEKFAEAHPDVDMVDFNQFLVDASALKSAGKIVSEKSTTSLDSDEKMEQLGIAPENQDAYRAHIKAVIDAKAGLKAIITTPGYGASFSITLNKKKAEAASE